MSEIRLKRVLRQTPLPGVWKVELTSQGELARFVLSRNPSEGWHFIPTGRKRDRWGKWLHQHYLDCYFPTRKAALTAMRIIKRETEA